MRSPLTLATITPVPFSITANSHAGVLILMANWVTALPRVRNHRFNPQPSLLGRDERPFRFLQVESTPVRNWTMDNSSAGGIEQTVKLATTGISTIRPIARALPPYPTTTTADIPISIRASCLLPLLLALPARSRLPSQPASV